MPQIREYNQVVGEPNQINPYERIGSPYNRARPEDFGADVGGALQHAGNTVSTIAQDEQRQNERKDVSNMQVELANARADLTATLNEQVRSGAITQADAQQQLESQMQDRIGAVQDRMETPFGRQTAAAYGGELAARFRESTMAAKAAAEGKLAVDNYTTALDKNRNTLLNDPMQFPGVLGETLAVLNDPNGPYARMDAVNHRKLETDTRKGLALSAVQGFIRNVDPEMAKKQLADGQWDQYLDADNKAALVGMADTTIRANQEEKIRNYEWQKKLKADADKQIADGFLHKAADGSLSNTEILNSTISEPMKEHFLAINKVRAFDLNLNPPSDPRAVDTIQRAIFADPADPHAITDPTAIEAAYTQHKPGDPGFINYQDMLRLRTNLLTDGRTSTFGRDLQHVAASAHSMFLHSALGSSLPDIAEESYYRWRKDLDTSVENMRAKGEDPRDLLNPKSKNYVLDAGRMQTYITSAPQLTRQQADGLKQNFNLPPIKISPEEEYATVPIGRRFETPDGNVRVRITGEVKAPPPKSGEYNPNPSTVGDLFVNAVTPRPPGAIDWSGNGLVTPGNIDLTARPVVKNADGSISTVRSMSFNEDGKEVLIPTVSDDGRILTDEEAIALYHKTGKFLGKFSTVESANAYAEQLHNQQANRYLPRQPGETPPKSK
jgi:hypothetical protein